MKTSTCQLSIRALLATGLLGCESGDSQEQLPIANASGVADSVITNTGTSSGVPAIRQLLGTNGRFCESCHAATNGWGTTPSDDQLRFTLTQTDRNDPTQSSQFLGNGQATSNSELDPLFRPVDGAVSPTSDVSTADARTTAYSLLLSRALFRIGLPMPPQSDFTLAAVDDPYGFASTQELSLFRRTLPMANLRFEQVVMWDGRETAQGATPASALLQQAIDATLGHAQAATAPPAPIVAQMVEEETDVYFAQRSDTIAGDLASNGGNGGPVPLASLEFYPGINSYPGPDPRGVTFDPSVFRLFDSWSSDPGARRASIARGQSLFNIRTFSMSGVSGLNDELDMPSVSGTCSTCHNTPNVGSDSQGRLFDVGVSDASRRMSDGPLYTFDNSSTGELRAMTDPGEGLVTGKWQHLGRFKVPGLRGLAAHPPYFHDGSAAAMADVVEYFDQRFQIALSPADKQDLTAFLGAL